MYNELKKHWDNQFRLSANKVFADFRRFLECGGAKAREFINENLELTETVFGDPDAIDAVLSAIEKDKEAAENQVYFFNQAMALLAAIRTLLARKYAASVRFCEQLGIDPADYTPETLLPGVRKDAEGGESDETPAADPDPDKEEEPAEETKGEEETGEGDAPETEETAADPDGGKEETEETPAETVEEPTPMTEDDLKARINLLVGDGASKNDVWKELAADAKSVGWTSRQVWAYIDEIAPPTEEK